MSLPIDPQYPPAPGMQQPYGAHSASGSVGPVVGVLVVIVVFALVAVVVGRLCSGKTVMGYGLFDLDTWAETKCSSCIDGRLTPPPPPLRINVSVAPATLPAVQTELPTKQQESASQNPPPNP